MVSTESNSQSTAQEGVKATGTLEIPATNCAFIVL